MRDLDELALALPGVTKELSDEGRPSYLANGKVFCFHRGPRPDAVDKDGKRLEDVLMFRVDGPEEKELVLADPRGIFFTTPHWNGYPAVLMRIRSLKQDTPDAHQFVAMCDCNVTANRDTGDNLVRGRITRPLHLETNYSADRHRRGSGIDYVMAERDSRYRIHSFRSYRHLVTDHPGIVATFTRAR